ncbi:hypothetical protein [Clostridium chrysemydis]|uniref:hypothetical protein n=1 Tax=Clostridium chrysemydis TaxID=2665504 RepID=UPI001883912F|nr:hypothetical protein [Clostridium chrysemydis]
MKIEFRNSDGEILLEKDSNELKDILSSITREGTTIKLFFGKDDSIHGFVNEVMYGYNKEENEESLSIYITEEYYHPTLKIRQKLDEINKNIENR